MTSTDLYVQLLTSEHRSQPQFEAVVRAVTQAFADGIDLHYSLIDKFDLDQATGAQLDVIGLWVGVSRIVRVPLTGVFFTWNDTAADGWERGVWKGPFDPSTGPVSVDDETYRLMIRAKIAANIWDGTCEDLCGFFDAVFGHGVVKPQDNQDMSITLLYDDLQMTTVAKALLTQGVFELKPMGVRYIYLAASGAPVFSWNMNTPRYQGWNGTSVFL